MIISEMQRKLATWTATESDRRVDRLLRLIGHPQWLRKAAEITLSSKGAKTPGVDGITKLKLQDGLDEYLSEIRIDLLSGTYQHLTCEASLYLKGQWETTPLRYSFFKRQNCQWMKLDTSTAHMFQILTLYHL